MKLDRLLVLLIATISSSFTMAKDTGSGNHLLNACNTFMSDSKQGMLYSEGLDAGYCVGLVSGIAETIIGSDNPTACFPKSSVTREQAVRVVVKYLNNHPEQLHLSASSLVMVSFEEAFPCKQ